jgi:hypothetical protein
MRMSPYTHIFSAILTNRSYEVAHGITFIPPMNDLRLVVGNALEEWCKKVSVLFRVAAPKRPTFMEDMIVLHSIGCL